jgi:hypothetical protein
MRAVRLHPPGGIEGLRLDEVAPPQPRPGQVLVRVHAAAITRAELGGQLTGYRPSPPMSWRASSPRTATGSRPVRTCSRSRRSTATG